MCFTLLGRLHTRQVMLVGPLLLALILAGASDDREYVAMFARMALVALALDLFVYSWLIRYQPRWLTIALGALEFVILVLISPQPVDVGRMAAFYIPAWLLGWLTLEIVLPLAWPRWAEDGGEYRRLGR